MGSYEQLEEQDQRINLLAHALSRIQQWAEVILEADNLSSNVLRAAIKDLGTVAREALDEIEKEDQ